MSNLEIHTEQSARLVVQLEHLLCRQAQIEDLDGDKLDLLKPIGGGVHQIMARVTKPAILHGIKEAVFARRNDMVALGMEETFKDIMRDFWLSREDKI